jgi:hypothetical protein
VIVHLFWLAWGCADGEDDGAHCEEFPAAAAEAPTVLTNEDDCGWWTVAVDDYLVVSLYVDAEEQPACELTYDDALLMKYGDDAAYSNLSNDEPKVTWQVFGAAATGEASWSASCDEGTEWAMRVAVE